MFKRNSIKSGAISTLIGAHTTVQGNLEFAGGCHVDGRVVGNVTTAAGAQGFLSVSEQGAVEGSVEVAQVLLNGLVNGDILARERVELGPKARVMGNVQYAIIEMALGAEINGKLIHLAPAKAEDAKA
ncbi:MAG: bactofilin family protein [Steroidobacteraceae bacterium]